MRHIFCIVMLAMCLVTCDGKTDEVTEATDAPKPEEQSEDPVKNGAADNSIASTEDPSLTKTEDQSNQNASGGGKGGAAKTEVKSVDPSSGDTTGNGTNALDEGQASRLDTAVNIGSATGNTEAPGPEKGPKLKENEAKEEAERKKLPDSTGEALQTPSSQQEEKKHEPHGVEEHVLQPVQQHQSIESDEYNNPTAPRKSKKTEIAAGIKSSVKLDGNNGNTYQTATGGERLVENNKSSDSPVSGMDKEKNTDQATDTAMSADASTSTGIKVDTQTKTLTQTSTESQSDLKTSTTELSNNIAATTDPKVTSTAQTPSLPIASNTVPLHHSVDKTDGILCSSSLFALAALATLAVAAAAPAH